MQIFTKIRSLLSGMFTNLTVTWKHAIFYYWDKLQSTVTCYEVRWKFLRQIETYSFLFAVLWWPVQWAFVAFLVTWNKYDDDDGNYARF